MTITVACILKGGPDYDIEAGGKVFHFEMHPYCGPTVLTKKGAVAEPQPPGRSPFWTAVSLWDEQGRRVDERGRCVWEPPQPTEMKLKHLGGRHYLVVADYE